MEWNRGRLPQARSRGLLEHAVPGGIIIYDTERDQAHSLNQTAAFVWQRCDGRTSAAELAAYLPQLGLPADEALVWLALARLETARLLAGPLPPAPAVAGITRRAVIRKLGLTGGLAVLVPVVTSMTAPPAAATTSGPPHNNKWDCCCYWCDGGDKCIAVAEGAPCPDPSPGCMMPHREVTGVYSPSQCQYVDPA